MEFKIELRGQEVVVRVTSFEAPTKGNQTRGNPDGWYPDEEGYAEFELLDGYDGEILDWDLTVEEDRFVEGEVFFVMLGMISDSHDSRYLAEEDW